MEFLKILWDNLKKGPVTDAFPFGETYTPDRLRGRVTAVTQIFIISSNEVGAFRAGTMAGAFGPVVAVVAGGVGTVLTVLGITALFPQLGRLGRLHELKAREE